MEMQGRHRDGVAWIGDLESSWSKTHNFRYHLYWHRALFHLEMEEFDTVLDLYDQQVARIWRWINISMCATAPRCCGDWKCSASMSARAGGRWPISRCAISRTVN